MSSAGAIYTSLLPGSLAAAANVPPTYASTTVNGQLVAVNLADIRYKRLNSYTELCTLISPRTIFQSTLPGCVFQINSISNYLADDPSVRIFIRFCRYDPTCEEQTDHMPRGFNFIINQKAYQVKNRITFCPYDITTRVICEASNDIYVRISLDPTTGENPDDFFFGVFLLQKISYQSLLNEFHARWRHPFKAKYSIELAKKKLNPIEFDDDELAIVDKDNSIKVSLLCPITSTRIKIPVRSINCDHVHCFDVENFIKINDISPKWKCPICNQYIKFDNLILDGFFTELLKKAPPTCNDVEILPDGSYEFVIDELPPGVEEGSGSASEDDSEKEKKEKREKEEEGENQQSSAAAGGKQPLVKRRKVEKIEKKKSKRSQAAAEPPKFVAKSSLTTVVNIECINLDSDDDDDADDDNANAAQGNGQAAAEVPEIANAEVENAVEDINIFPDAVDPVLAEDLDHLLNAECK
ncbi:PREDICTED: E3 SUMO-protein ligase PIAS1-like [Rhagoletis zephyria]|uniref:E3 SUMO-protein ligase PIAS1-like n=1 Tax=Rhagoletis zephyria TaxID=28612 RepID=UPI0008112B22|nr:PREDICTED: E3 SUMO-protein ligase PIAS1-like [Rhagoletis zephyria]